MAHSVIWSRVLIYVRNKRKTCRLKPEMTVGAIRAPGPIFILSTSLPISSKHRQRNYIDKWTLDWEPCLGPTLLLRSQRSSSPESEYKDGFFLSNCK